MQKKKRNEYSVRIERKNVKRSPVWNGSKKEKKKWLFSCWLPSTAPISLFIWHLFLLTFFAWLSFYFTAVAIEWRAKNDDFLSARSYLSIKPGVCPAYCQRRLIILILVHFFERRYLCTANFPFVVIRAVFFLLLFVQLAFLIWSRGVAEIEIDFNPRRNNWKSSSVKERAGGGPKKRGRMTPTTKKGSFFFCRAPSYCAVSLWSSRDSTVRAANAIAMVTSRGELLTRAQDLLFRRPMCSANFFAISPGYQKVLLLLSRPSTLFV